MTRVLGPRRSVDWGKCFVRLLHDGTEIHVATGLMFRGGVTSRLAVSATTCILVLAEFRGHWVPGTLLELEGVSNPPREIHKLRLRIEPVAGNWTVLPSDPQRGYRLSNFEIVEYPESDRSTFTLAA